MPDFSSSFKLENAPNDDANVSEQETGSQQHEKSSRNFNKVCELLKAQKLFGESDRRELTRRESNLVRKMVNNGMLEVYKNKLVIDKEKITNLSFQKGADDLGYTKRRELISLLQNTSAISKTELENQTEDNPAQERAVLPTPQSKEELIMSYGPKSESAMINIWDLGGHVGWSEKVQFSGDTHTNVAEMFMLNLLQRLQYRRRDGNLEVFDPTDDEYKLFSANFLRRKLGIQITTQIDGETYTLGSSSKFAQKLLPNLLEAGIIEMSDFERHGGGEHVESRFGGSWREIKSSSPNNSLSNADGLTALYYTGRGEIPGTNIDQRETEATMKKLDENTMGIFTDTHGRRQLQYKMHLLPSEVLREKRDQVKKQLEEKGKKSTERMISKHTTVRADEVADLVEEFDITNEVHQHKGESAVEYARRTARLSDYQYITDTFQEFVSQTGIDALSIPWKEQVILADAITTVPDKDKLVDFTRKFDSSGLRTFLAVDYERGFSDTIFQIADQLSDRQAQQVFDTYSEIIDACEDIQEVIRRNLDEKPDQELIETVTDKVQRDGKKVLETVANQSKDIESALENLQDASRSSQALLGSLYGFVNEGLDIDLRELRDVKFTKRSATDISSEEIEAMREIYLNNYPADEYTEILRQKLVDKLNDLFFSEGNEFYTLSYKGDLKGFVGFKEGESEASERPIKQAAAFNVDSSFQNHAIGHLMIENALAEEAEGATLVANSKAQSLLTSRYIERGFVGTTIDRQEQSSDLLDIVWDKKTNQSYRFKPMVEEEIIRLFTENQVQGAAEFSTGEKIKKVNSLTDLNYIDLDEDKVLTRLFEHEDGWLAVFEPAPDKEYPESMK